MRGKWRYVLPALFLLAGLEGCLMFSGGGKPTAVFEGAVNTLEGVTMTLSRAGSASAEAVFTNDTGGEVIFGADYALQKQVDGQWYGLSTRAGNHTFTGEAYVVPARGTLSWEIDWESLYGVLSPGSYRMVKSVISGQGTDGAVRHDLAAEFVVE